MKLSETSSAAFSHDPEMLQAALLAGGVGVWDWNLTTLRARLSPTLEATLGLPSGLMDGALDEFVSLLHPIDQQRVSDAVRKASRDGGLVDLEFRTLGADGQIRWFVTKSETLSNRDGEPARLVGTVQELPAGVVAERRMRRQQAALLRLVGRDLLRGVTLQQAVGLICEAAAETLDVARAGVWLYNDDQSVMHCLSIFDRATRRHASDDPLPANACPEYFAALREKRALAVVDAQHDPRTSELTASYLAPLGITSMLDCAIRRGGQQVGVLCHEHIGPMRSWTLDEQTFAASVADVVAKLLESHDRRQMQAALHASEERYRAFVAQCTESIWRADLDPPVSTKLSAGEQIDQVIAGAKLTECNHAMQRMLGRDSAASIIGQQMSSLGGERRTRAALQQWIDNGYRLRDFEIASKDPDGQTMWVAVSMVGVVEHDMIVRVWGIWRDVTDRRIAIEALEHQTLHDTLTGLPNRKWLNTALDNAIRKANRDSNYFALMLIDLDHFKEVNDTLGHFAGDQLLKAIGPRLTVRLQRYGGVLTRLGGDEFAVLVPQIFTEIAARNIADELLQEVRQPFDLQGARLEIGASIGIAIYPKHGEDASTLLRHADVAMYVAKKQTKGSFIYQPDRDPHSPRRLALLSDLGATIRGNHLTLHYQPRVNLRDGTVSGIEALARWPHTSLGMVPASEFIALAEMGDLIKPLTRWVLEQTLRQWRVWHDEGLRQRVSINLSAKNLLDERTVNDVSELLHRYNVPPEALELELTESAFMIDPDRALHYLQRIGAHGVQLAIDDFGSGFSSLSYLRRMPIRTLKIDRAFVENMTAENADATIVSSTINLAHNLGMKVVAEGIEREGTYHMLMDMGCDEAQGFWIARPMAADQVKSWCERTAWRVH